MRTIVVTGSNGLIGSECVNFFINNGFKVIGIDNDLRCYFFNLKPKKQIDNITNYTYFNYDIRDYDSLEKIFIDYSDDISCIIHTAAQPSHDWAVKEPMTDFSVNVTGTLNLLELFRKYCPKSVFIFTSTNKVYGDNPNYLDLIEMDKRFEVIDSSKYYNGINEEFSIDRTTHSLFGCSKLSSDIYVQEYGKYFGLKTVVFRGGCLTGSRHNGAELHGFLNYLVKCNLTKKKYNIFGYKGKQVRDNIHSLDLVNAFHEVIKNPKIGEVYNIGGGRESNCSLIEAIDIIEYQTGIKMDYEYFENNRIGDHIWWISDISKFKKDYPNWGITKNVHQIIDEIIKNIEVI